MSLSSSWNSLSWGAPLARVSQSQKVHPHRQARQEAMTKRAVDDSAEFDNEHGGHSNERALQYWARRVA